MVVLDKSMRIVLARARAASSRARASASLVPDLNPFWASFCAATNSISRCLTRADASARRAFRSSIFCRAIISSTSTMRPSWPEMLIIDPVVSALRMTLRDSSVLPFKITAFGRVLLWTRLTRTEIRLVTFNFCAALSLVTTILSVFPIWPEIIHPEAAMASKPANIIEVFIMIIRSR